MKLTKKQEKEAVKNIGKVIGGLAKIIKEDAEKFRKEMVDYMKMGADILEKAKKRGVNIEKEMIKVREEYNQRFLKKE